MTLPIHLGRASARGSLNLFLGIAISNIILAIGAIIIARLLGSASYGLYTLASVPATFFGLFVGFGVRNAVVKYSAQFNHRNEDEKVKAIVVSQLVFIVTISSVLALVSFLLSRQFAYAFTRPNVGSLMELYSFVIITDALIVASQSVFVGLEKTQYYSITLVFQAILRTVISPLLVMNGYGPLGAVAGYTGASFCTSILGISLVYLLVKKTPFSLNKEAFLSNVKTLIGFGFPLYIRNLVEAGFRTQFLNLLMPIYASDILIGNYKVALNFQVLVNFFAIPIATVLFPAFSKLEYRHDQETLETIFASSVKYTSMIIVPATAILIVLSDQIVSTLYGQAYTLAPLYLSISCLGFLHSAFGQYSINALLNGQGETKKSMMLGLANVAIVLPLALILVPRFKIAGLIVASIASTTPSVIAGSLWVKKLYGISIDWNHTWKILACSSATGAVTLASISYITLSSPVKLAIGILIFLSSFTMLAPLIGAINLNDISNLRSVFGEMGRISKVLDVPLRFLSKSCKFAEYVHMHFS